MARFQPNSVICLLMVYGIIHPPSDTTPYAPLSVALLACLLLCGRPLLILPWVASITADSLSLFAVPSRMADGMDLPLFVGSLGYLTDSTDHRRRTRSLSFLLIVRHLSESGHFGHVAVAIAKRCWTISLQPRTVFLLTTTGRLLTAVCCCAYFCLCVQQPLGHSWLTPLRVIRCVFRQRVDNIRPFLIALYIVFFLYSVLFFGTVRILPSRLSSLLTWSKVDTGALCGLHAFIQGAILWFACNWPDLKLGTIGSLSLVISCLLLSLASKTQMVIVGTLCGSAILLLPTSVLSILSKLIESNETGSMYAGIGFLMITSHLVAVPSYRVLEEMCNEAKIPQAIFLLPFGLATFVMLFYIYLQRSVNPELLGYLEIDENSQLLTNDSVEPIAE